MSIFFSHIICLQGDNKVFLPSRNISKRVAWSNSGKQNNNGIDIIKNYINVYFWLYAIIPIIERSIFSGLRNTLYTPCTWTFMTTMDYRAMERHTYNILSTVNIKETYMAGIFLITALTGTRAFLPSANQSSPFFIWGSFSPRNPSTERGRNKRFSQEGREAWQETWHSS